MSDLDDEQGRWADWFFMVGLIAATLGVIAPYRFNRDIKDDFQHRMN